MENQLGTPVPFQWPTVREQLAARIADYERRLDALRTGLARAEARGTADMRVDAYEREFSLNPDAWIDEPQSATP